MSRVSGSEPELGGAWLRALALLVPLIAVSTLGCASVKPYERGALARRCMQRERDPQAKAIENHVYEYREGAIGATGTRGGGCGCN